MAGKRKPGITPGGDLMGRLQKMLYEFHDLGCFEEARPHILWLMEIAEIEARKPPATARLFSN